MVALTCAVTRTVFGAVTGPFTGFTEGVFLPEARSSQTGLPTTGPVQSRRTRMGTDYHSRPVKKGVNNYNYVLCVSVMAGALYSAVAVTVAAAEITLELRGDGVAARLRQLGGVLALLKLLDVLGHLGVLGRQLVHAVFPGA